MKKNSHFLHVVNANYPEAVCKVVVLLLDGI